jgi:hypothetical protein
LIYEHRHFTISWSITTFIAPSFRFRMPSQPKAKLGAARDFFGRTSQPGMNESVAEGHALRWIRMKQGCDELFGTRRNRLPACIAEVAVASFGSTNS